MCEWSCCVGLTGQYAVITVTCGAIRRIIFTICCREVSGITIYCNWIINTINQCGWIFIVPESNITRGKYIIVYVVIICQIAVNCIEPTVAIHTNSCSGSCAVSCHITRYCTVHQINIALIIIYCPSYFGRTVISYNQIIGVKLSATFYFHCSTTATSADWTILR